MNAPDTCPALYFGQQCVMDYGHEGIHRLDDAINTAFSDDIADGAPEAHNRASRPVAASAGSETPDAKMLNVWLDAIVKPEITDAAREGLADRIHALFERASRSSASPTQPSVLFTDEDRAALKDWLDNTDWDGADPHEGERANAVHRLIQEFDVRGTSIRRLAQPPTSAPVTDADVKRAEWVAGQVLSSGQGSNWLRALLEDFVSGRAPSADAAPLIAVIRNAHERLSAGDGAKALAHLRDAILHEANRR